MAMIARILGVALGTAGLGAGLGYVLFGNLPEWRGLSLLLGCVGSVVGAIAGTAREAVTALQHKPSI